MPPLSTFDHSQANEAAEHIRGRVQCSPEVAVLTGTGLGDSIPIPRIEAAIDYREIPHFPTSTAPSHYGRLSVGKLAGRDTVLMQGRFHLYEGYCPLAVTFPIRVMQALGVKVLIMTNAAGGLNPHFATGDIMIIEDHINLTGANPLTGTHNERWGPRFPEMTHAYNGHLRRLAQSASRNLDVRVQAGVYAGLAGPSLETPAEMRYLHTIGAEAVGFSTVMETIAAVHAGLHVLGLSVITNMCLPHAPTPVDVQAVIAVAQSAASPIGRIISSVVEHLDK